ncbi:MAG TPA: response regulator [Thermoanaerobaculia bacterium]|nr:response regulator [Thermoanaerobaculia bacterium]HUM30393.1 response regulator [Thermoanaerobaculia bacterium]HXK68596.1 response regulator [Thermoanaerobaculia bacterium]
MGAGPVYPVDPGLKRFKLSVQKNRAFVYTLAALFAIALQQLGLIKGTFLQAFTVLVLAVISSIVFYVAYIYFWKLNLDWVWLLFDSFLISCGVYLTGGVASPWFPWYLANVSGAAFVAGMEWAVALSIVDTFSYLGVLAIRGEIAGLDGVFWEKLAMMACLFGSTFFFFRGATELQRKQKQVKLLRENESRKVAELTRLTTILDERTRELDEANFQIRHADKMKSQFLANMSHELRTPLNSIIGFSEILISRLESELSDKYLKFLSNIHTSGIHLLGIINDLLDLSKIEAGRMEVNAEKFPLEGVIHGVCTVMKGMAAKRNISFEVDLPEHLPPLHADPVKVKQMLYNLLSNSVKFSPDDSTITIRGSHVEAGESALGVDSISIQVVDRGIGIAPENHDMIFQEFSQVDNAPTRQFQGTGLGLALVRRFVELHKGTIQVDSAVNQGSTFTILLPSRFIADGSSREPETALPVVTTTALPRILVVEDDPDAYERISKDLAVAHFIPVRAKNGEEAVRLARLIKPAAITLDIILPDIDGWEVLKRLKQDGTTRNIPILIVSMVENQDLAVALGADDYFLKPIEGESLVKRLTQLVPPESTRSARILLIDDDSAVHEMVEALLEPIGFRLDHAYNGKEGLELASQNPPSLIMLDLMMEGMDGFDVAAVLRNDPRTSYLPILVLTAKDLTEAERKRLHGKINGLLQKGSSGPQELISSVKHLVRRHSKEIQHEPS